MNIRPTTKQPPAYALYEMSRQAYQLLRDRADWEFAQHHGLGETFCGVYEDAMRYQAEQIIAAGMVAA